eukprot:760264-Hanusia_phi.AAC.3
MGLLTPQTMLRAQKVYRSVGGKGQHVAIAANRIDVGSICVAHFLGVKSRNKGNSSTTTWEGGASTSWFSGDGIALLLRGPHGNVTKGPVIHADMHNVAGLEDRQDDRTHRTLGPGRDCGGGGQD